LPAPDKSPRAVPAGHSEGGWSRWGQIQSGSLPRGVRDRPARNKGSGPDASRALGLRRHLTIRSGQTGVIMTQGVRDRAIPPEPALAEFRWLLPSGPMIEGPNAAPIIQEGPPEVVVPLIQAFVVKGVTWGGGRGAPSLPHSRPRPRRRNADARIPGNSRGSGTAHVGVDAPDRGTSDHIAQSRRASDRNVQAAQKVPPRRSGPACSDVEPLGMPRRGRTRMDWITTGRPIIV